MREATGLFAQLGTPVEREEKVIRKALEARRDNWPHEGFVYRSAGDLLLQHGKFYSGRQLPDQYAHHKGIPNQCFVNAMTACERDPTLLYVEGVYTVGRGHYTPHAWCLDPAGKLLEVTLPTDDETLAVARDFETGRPFPPLEQWGYWGAVFHPEYVRAIWEGQDGHVGILDRPSLDAASGNAEWRTTWPVLTVPYDPDRREP